MTINNHISQPSIQKLPNGVTIIAEQIPIDAVNLNIWLNVGSSVETDDINGMAHFLEHMVFKGSQYQATGEFEQVIESHGGKTNAATSQDYTYYHITVAPGDFAKLTPLQVDLVLNATIPDPEFQRERLVVLEEIRRSYDNPAQRVYRHMREMVYAELPYRRAVLGTEEVITKLSSEQMRSFHRSWYRPENITVVVVGNLPVAEMITVVAKCFEGLPTECLNGFSTSNLKQIPSETASEPAYAKIERTEITDAALQQARMVMTWRVPGLNHLKETLPLNVLASILGSGRTSRLIKDLREERNLVDRISVSNDSQCLQGIFQISAQLPEKHIPEVENLIQLHLRKLQEELVSSLELAKIRTQVVNRFIFGSESPKERAGIYGYYDRIVGNLEAALQYPELIKSISPTDLQNSAQKYLNPNAYGILVVKP